MKSFLKRFRFSHPKHSGISMVIAFGLLLILFVVFVAGYKALNNAMDVTVSMQNRKNEMPDESGDLELNFVFKKEVQSFSLELSQARRNANLNKKCNRKNKSIAWQLFIQGTESNRYSLKCFYQDGDILGEVQFPVQEFSSNEIEIESIFIKDDIPLDPEDELLITFYSITPKTKIEYRDDELHEVDDIRIVFNQVRGTTKKMAICLTKGESIQTVNLNGATCE